MIGLVGMLVIDNQEQYFQVPSNVVQDSINLALQDKLDARPFFGAYYISISKEYAITNNLDRDSGALIFSPSGKQGLAIIADSPAEKSGLRINDIVISVNDKTIDLDNPLSNLISQYKKGEQVELTVDRNGEEIKIPVQL
jgi:serine protease Do